MTTQRPDLPPLRDVIATHGLRTKKSLGQHFLLDTNLTEKIVRLTGDLSQQHIIEIGPGPGGLTRALLTSDAASITVIEKDSRAIPALRQLVPYSNERLHIIEDDALRVNLTEVAPAPRSIIANLPYNVGTELLLTWLQDIAQHAQSYSRLTLMFQKEVGERIASAPGTKAYGRLSVLAQWLCDVSLVMSVPASAFSPPPKVDSVIVQLIPLGAPRYQAPLASLETVLRTAFNQRRKMLRSALKPLGVVDKLASIGLDETLRPDQLSIQQYCQLARLLSTGDQ